MAKVEEIDMYGSYSELLSVMEALNLMEGHIVDELDHWVWLLQATQYMRGGLNDE